MDQSLIACSRCDSGWPAGDLYWDRDAALCRQCYEDSIRRESREALTQVAIRHESKPVKP